MAHSKVTAAKYMLRLLSRRTSRESPVILQPQSQYQRPPHLSLSLVSSSSSSSVPLFFDRTLTTNRSSIMSAPLPPLSASVTRILSLTGFPPELKTKDIQAAFSEWESVGGGFKIKWVNDTSLLLVFADAGVGEFRNHQKKAKKAHWKLFNYKHTSYSVPTRLPNLAKRAYLQSLLNPPPTLTSISSNLNLQIKPYDGDDAQVSHPMA
jgi:hypothetical protein